MHVLEQLSGEANIGICASVDNPIFTVSSLFFARNTELENGLVIVMGCNGLEKGDLGKVFVDAGAGAVVGRRNPVTIEETDEAVLGFIDDMLSGDSLGVAVESPGLSIHPAGSEMFRLG